jgi:osmotically-inducible protein OsmY
MNPARKSGSFADAADAELAKAVQLFLNANRTGYRRIIVWAEEGTVSLSGSVRSFFLRQMAVVLAKRVAGVRHVVDGLEVDWKELGSHGEPEP